MAAGQWRLWVAHRGRRDRQQQTDEACRRGSAKERHITADCGKQNQFRKALTPTLMHRGVDHSHVLGYLAKMPAKGLPVIHAEDLSPMQRCRDPWCSGPHLHHGAELFRP